MNTKSLDLILEKVQLFDPNLGLLFDQAAAELAELKEENEKNRLGTEIHYWVKITRLRAELDKANKVITDGVQAINTDFVNNNRVGLSTWFLAALPQEDKHD